MDKTEYLVILLLIVLVLAGSYFQGMILITGWMILPLVAVATVLRVLEEIEV